MPELQSCANSVNAAALCARSRGCSLEFSASPLDYEEKQEVKVESINVVAQLSAELQRERQKNAELVEKISVLEALIQKREENAIVPVINRDVCPIDTDRSFRKCKRQKTEPKSGTVKDKEITRGGNFSSEVKHDNLLMVPKDTNKQERLVNWMTIDDTWCCVSEIYKDEGSAAYYDDTDDSAYDDTEYGNEDGAEVDDTDRKVDECSPFENIVKFDVYEEGDNSGKNTQYLENSLTGQSKLTVVNMNKGHNNKALLPDTICIANKKDMKKRRIKGNNITRGCKEVLETDNHGQEVGHKESATISLHKKSLKVPFCPQEVKRIIESEVLLTKNAQSHTMRKIIVFGSLGISHGCEDIYELDFNHFSILHKGEPYVSPKNPGEHVLYEHPGLRRKVFYPNSQNPTLCPVQILEEEKAMRPSDPSCPSCLFLCIKYGGSTRNLPQNEYVRQRMGRNKLKSFGPLMCKMALLVYIRNGSFFFKALGITLLFMAGFSEELVQRETKYRNLDLIQKYYRKDEDAAGDELFHSYPIPYDILAGKLTKSSCKKQIGSACKNPNTTSEVLPSIPSSSVPSTQFGLLGYASLHSHAMAASQSMASPNVQNTPPMTNSTIATSSTSVPYHTGQIPPLYPMPPPPHPANTFLPMMYWPHPNPFPSCPYPTYAYRPFHPPGNYTPLHPPSYYGPLFHAPLMMTEVAEDPEKKHMTKGEVHSESDSSSSSTKSKKP